MINLFCRDFSIKCDKNINNSFYLNNPAADYYLNNSRNNL
jgi:hypothetical protein